MYGCGLPVCALAYPCIGELVSHEHNGLLFATPEQLAQQFLDLFRGFPATAEDSPSPEGGASGGGSGLLSTLRRGVAASGMARWHDSWQRVVLPLLEG